VKSADRQAALLDYIAPKVRLWRKARDFLVRQRKQVVAPKACFQHDAIRAHLGEFGIVAPKACFQHDAKGIHNVDRLLDTARDVPDAARPALDMLTNQLFDTQARIKEVTARISEMQAKDALARRLATVPGVGSISSSAFAATPPDVAAFRSARDYVASC
jgi:transposase